jgi:glyoxylase-like metal-dependent hydrolase (beta-lactamase superfamily II)
MTVRIEAVEPEVRRVHCRTLRGAAVGYDVSAYLVRGVLVDTGFARVRDELMDAVRELSPRGAMLTHWHEDHAGNAPAFVKAGIPLALDARCESILRERPHIALYRSLIWGTTPRLTTPVVPFDPSPLEIIPTPGHTADHQVLWDPERRILASGDLFLGVKVRVAHEHESPRQLLASLRRVAALEPRLLLDAHRGPVTNVASLLRAKIGWMEETMGEMLALARAGADEREIRERVLGSEDFVGRVSFGEYSKLAFVRGVLREEGEER